MAGVIFINILCTLFSYERKLSRYFGATKVHSQNVTREKLLNFLSYKKSAHKMLMKMTPGHGHRIIIISLNAKVRILKQTEVSGSCYKNYSSDTQRFKVRPYEIRKFCSIDTIAGCRDPNA